MKRNAERYMFWFVPGSYWGAEFSYGNLSFSSIELLTQQIPGDQRETGRSFIGGASQGGQILGGGCMKGRQKPFPRATARFGLVARISAQSAFEYVINQ